MQFKYLPILPVIWRRLPIISSLSTKEKLFFQSQKMNFWRTTGSSNAGMSSLKPLTEKTGSPAEDRITNGRC